MFKDFLKIQELYKLKEVARNTSNFYYSQREDIQYERKETTAEHVFSSLKLADYFLSTEKEFENLDRLKVYELLMYHDDIEIDTEEISISERDKRKNKENIELKALPKLANKYPKKLKNKLLKMDNEFRELKTQEFKFAHAIDKMDALIHELKYPQDWAPKGFDEKNVKEWFQPSFEYSSTFLKYFKQIIEYLKKNVHFTVLINNNSSQ